MVVVIRFRGLHSDCRVPLTSLMVLADNMHIYVDSLFHDFFAGKIFVYKGRSRKPATLNLKCIIFNQKNVAIYPPMPLLML